MRRVPWSVVLVAVSLCLSAGAASAHGKTITTNPKKNARVAMPKVVSVNLTEEPVPQSKLQVTDGCGQDVTERVSIDGKTLQASVGEAQPGRWKASYRMISAVDGHPTEDDWTFNVRGTADCNADDDEAAEEPSEEPEASPDESEDIDETAAAEGDDSDTDGTSAASGTDDSSFPVVPVVLGGVALLSLAAVVRAKTAG